LNGLGILQLPVHFVGVLLAQIVSLKYDALPAHYNNVIEERKLLRAARGLLSSVTKVLLLADKVIVIQILRAKDAVHNYFPDGLHFILVVFRK
jgi:hypothetical protein